MKKILFLLVFIIHTHAYSQHLPVYSHFFINPYKYNPSFVGANKYDEVYFSHRQQWLGVEGAPITSNLSVHLPTKGKLAYGINISSDKRGLLTSSAALFTSGYTARLGKDQFLKAGLSFGVGMHGLNREKVSNPNDPAIASFVSNNLFLDGNIGINYQYKNLNLGVALPKIFQKSVVITDESHNLQVKRVDNFLLTAGYKFNIPGSNLTFEPQLLYQLAEGMPNQLEALGILTIREQVWFGGSYREHYGPTAFAGFKISESLRLSYGYELTSSKVNGFGNGTHEVTLNVRFGKKKEATPKTLSLKRPISSIPAKKEKEITTGEEKIILENKPVEKSKIVSSAPMNKDSVTIISKNVQKTTFRNDQNQIVQKDQENEVAKLEEKIEVQKPINKLELAKGHYVVVNAFRVFDNVLKYHEDLSDKYHNCKFGFSSKSLYYYSYVLYTTDINRARFERNKLRKTKGFEKTWVLTVE